MSPSDSPENALFRPKVASVRAAPGELIRACALSDRTAIMAVADNPYLRDAVLTATPEQLQLMLYDGAIRFALQGRDAILRNDFEASFDKLTRAQNILLEMLNGLNYEVNRELCERVASVYNFIYRKLVDANVHRDPQAIDDAVRVLRIERETWQLLVDKVGRLQNPSPSAAGVSRQPSNDDAQTAGLSVEG